MIQHPTNARQDGNYLIGIAASAATRVDPVLQTQLRRPEQLNDPDYVRAVEPLRQLRRAVPDIHYLYTFARDNVGGVHFVLDAADPNATNKLGQADQSGVWEPYIPRNPALLHEALGDGVHVAAPTASFEPFTDEWGTFMSGLAPVLDEEGHQIGVIGVDVDASR